MGKPLITTFFSPTLSCPLRSEFEVSLLILVIDMNCFGLGLPLFLNLHMVWSKQWALVASRHIMGKTGIFFFSEVSRFFTDQGHK